VGARIQPLGGMRERVGDGKAHFVAALNGVATVGVRRAAHPETGMVRDGQSRISSVCLIWRDGLPSFTPTMDPGPCGEEAEWYRYNLAMSDQLIPRQARWIGRRGRTPPSP